MRAELRCPGTPPCCLHACPRRFLPAAGMPHQAFPCLFNAGLELLEPLASASGGTMLLYPCPEAAALPQASPLWLTCLEAARVVQAASCPACPAPDLLLLNLAWPMALFPCPQDVYKTVTQPRAFACMLRLRCSPELRVDGAHGRLAADRHAAGAPPPCTPAQPFLGNMQTAPPLHCPSTTAPLPHPLHLPCTPPTPHPPCCSEHENLWRLVTCGPDDAFAFDLDRTRRRAAGSAPAVQLVFQYSMLVPVAAGGQGAAAAAPGSRWGRGAACAARECAWPCLGRAVAPHAAPCSACSPSCFLTIPSPSTALPAGSRCTASCVSSLRPCPGPPTRPGCMPAATPRRPPAWRCTRHWRRRRSRACRCGPAGVSGAGRGAA